MPTLPRQRRVGFGDYKQKDEDVNVNWCCFPEAEQLFSLEDHSRRRDPAQGVAGFGRAFNFLPEALKKVSTL
jgi:hypothetical protein